MRHSFHMYISNHCCHRDMELTKELRKAESSDILAILLMVLFHIRFVYMAVLDFRSVYLDALFYIIVMAALLTMRINNYVKILIPIALISIVNPATRNLFLIFSTSYLVADRLSVRDFARINVGLILMVFIAVWIMNYLGITNDNMVEYEFYAEGEIKNVRKRGDWGFSNPNRLAMFIYSFIINAYVMVKKNHYRIFCVFIAGLTFLIYSITLSRTFVMSMMVFILCVWCLKSESIVRTFVKAKHILAFFPLFFLFLILYLAKIGYTNIIIDILTSGRLRLYMDFINQCTLRDYLIGTDMINQLTIDNSYLHLLFLGGVLGLAISSYLWIKTILKINVSNAVLLPIFASMACYGIMESIWTMLLCYGNMLIWVIMTKIVVLDRKVLLNSLSK